MNQNKNDSDQIINKINLFYDKHKKIILRTNNETGSLGLHIINDRTEIPIILDQLKERVIKNFTSFKDSKIMCVEFINPEKNNNYNDLYRVHIIFDEVLSYYVLTSKKDTFHSVENSIDDIDRFIDLNHKFKSILPSIKNKLIKAVKVLGSNIGAIEFFLINKEPCFIELNPIWGGHPSRDGFGNDKMMSHIYLNKKNLINTIPNIYNWLDYENYYKKMYTIINSHYNANF